MDLPYARIEGAIKIHIFYNNVNNDATAEKHILDIVQSVLKITFGCFTILILLLSAWFPIRSISYMHICICYPQCVDEKTLIFQNSYYKI